MRVPLMILSALGAGLVAGRKLLGKEISGRKNKAVESAVREARHRIRADTMLFVSRSFRRFAITTGIKLAILLWLWGLHHFAGMPRPIFATITVMTLAVFMIRDLWINYPVIKFTLTELHRHGWHPKRALTETIAARVFEEVLVEAGNQKQTRTGAVMLMLAGEDRSQMHHDVATAVADVARVTTWDDIRPYMISAAVRIGTLTLIYSASVWVLVHY
nr:hypothetical protein [uncultured Hyphomonas sp.]